MIIHPYPESFLSEFRRKMGHMFDYAINDCQMEGSVFIHYFLESSISKRIEFGDITVIAGRSGIELARDVIYEITKEEIEIASGERMYRTKEFWIGWAISYYQWYTTRSFRDIFKAVPYDDLAKIYYPLHEADIEKFIDVINFRMKEYFKDPKLKIYRKKIGMTQKELAMLSGVSLRSIQMYEERQKDINKASVDKIYALSRVLKCPIEYLIEK